MFDIVHGSFIWNAAKERVNIERHGIDFTTASLAFKDPHRIVTNDEAHSQNEDRFFCVGKVGLRIITVRFTYRGEMTRIIGAGAWRKGRELYEKKTRS